MRLRAQRLAALAWLLMLCGCSTVPPVSVSSGLLHECPRPPAALLLPVAPLPPLPATATWPVGPSRPASSSSDVASG